MRNLLICAVLLFCMAELGNSYMCYTCTMATSDQSCMKVSNCTGAMPYCGTTIVDGIIIKWVNKFCSAACVSATQNFTMVSATETCCTSNLCNNLKIGNANSFNFGNGASGLTGGAFLLVTIACLLSAVFAV